MATPIIMPKFGQMTEESVIIEWHKKEGDNVAKGDVLFDVETDKAVMEVESFAEGVLLKIVVSAGISVPVQSTVGFIGQPGESIPQVAVPRPPSTATTKPAVVGPLPSAGVPVAVSQPQIAAPREGLPASGGQARPTTPQPTFFCISPRARKLAEECVIDPTPIKGSGPNGRVIEKDVKAYLEARGYDQRRITPAAKTLAAQEKIDLLSVTPGDGGSITVAEVKRAIAEKPKPMSKMRQVIAQRLTQSFTSTPHFFVTVSADMTDLIALRAQLKEKGAPYTITDFISESIILTLQEFPDVNSTTDGKTVRWHSHVHLGLAVSLEQGLVVPVIRNAEDLTILEVSQRSKVLAEKARTGKLTMNEMSGSTFTISNMGMLDVENFTAIINPGESAILAVSSTLPQPVVRNGQVVARSMMKMTLASDHRIVDGATAVRFVNAIKKKLEDIELWKRLTS